MNFHDDLLILCSFFQVPKSSTSSAKHSVLNGDPIINILESDMVKDLKIAIAIADLENFAKRKETEETEATRKGVILNDDLIENTMPIKEASQNYNLNKENNVNDNFENSKEHVEEKNEVLSDSKQQKESQKFSDLQMNRLKDIDKMYNPWLSRNHQHSENEELLEVPSEEFEMKTIASTGCSIRAFKNASVYSSSEFIHEYIDYKKCIKDNKGESKRLISTSTQKSNFLIIFP